MLLFLLHLIILVFSSIAIAYIWLGEKRKLDVIILAYLLSWSNIIVISLVLSFLKNLNSLTVYFFFSISVNLLLLLYSYITIEREFNFPKNIIPTINLNFSLKNLLFIFLGIVLFLQLVICFHYLPFTPDTLSVKLVKIYAYLQNSALLPNKDFDGGMIFMSPLNSAITWMFFIIHQVPFQFIHFLNLFNWIIIGITSYLLCKKLKVSKEGAILATSFLICSDLFIINSTGDNDDMLCASSFILAIYYFVCWIVDKKKMYASLSGVAIGINLGIKPFAAMYYLFVLGIFLVIFFKNDYSVKKNFIKKYYSHALIPILISIFFLSGVFYENYKLRGNPLLFSKIISSLRNSPFSFKTAGINLTLQNVELFLNPILMPTGINDRKGTSESINRNVTAFIYKYFETNAEEFREIHSAHQGNINVASEIYYDHSGDFGFYPHLLVIFIFCGIIFFKNLNPVILLLGSSFLFAEFTYCTHNKNVDAVHRYWMMLLVATTPIFGYIYDNRNSIKPRFVKNILILLIFCNLIHIIFTSIYGLFNNSYRSIGAILNKNYHSSYESLFNQRFIETLPLLKEFNFYHVNTYPQAIIHFLAGKSKVYSKLSLVEKDPNIITAKQLKITERDYNLSPKYLPIEIMEINSGYFVEFGEGLGSKYYVNNFPKNLERINDKKEILFVFYQTSEFDRENLTVQTVLFNKFEGIDSFQCRYFSIDAFGVEYPLSEWGSFQNRFIVFSKQHKFIKIKVKNIKTSKKYENQYPI
jgi:hypothetical protein